MSIRNVMECGDSSPLSAGDLSPSTSDAHPVIVLSRADASPLHLGSKFTSGYSTATSRLLKAARTRRTPKQLSAHD